MSVSISISEQQITDSPNAPQVEDHSNSVNEQPMIVMPLKNRCSADDTNYSEVLCQYLMVRLWMTGRWLEMENL
jgi:hypothetical protein